MTCLIKMQHESRENVFIFKYQPERKRSVQAGRVHLCRPGKSEFE